MDVEDCVKFSQIPHTAEWGHDTVSGESMEDVLCYYNTQNPILVAFDATITAIEARSDSSFHFTAMPVDNAVFETARSFIIGKTNSALFGDTGMVHPELGLRVFHWKRRCPKCKCEKIVKKGRTVSLVVHVQKSDIGGAFDGHRVTRQTTRYISLRMAAPAA